jgi:proline dehydrogenase
MKSVRLFRKAVLSVTGNRLVKSLVTAHGMKLGASRFVAAETLEATIAKVQSLNRKGLAVTLDYLGESVDSRELAEQSAEVVLRTFDAIQEHGLDANVSVKLTQLGLLVDESLCAELMERIVGRAKGHGNFVRIDMEDSTATDATLRLFERLAERFGKRHVGVVLQAYLYRTPRDRLRLERMGANVRIVKGAYMEPPSVAFSRKREVDRQYVMLAEAHMRSGCYTAIATHDKRIIERLRKVRHTRGVGKVRCEFQMLYGIAEDLQLQLAAQGYRVRVYTPFGSEWYAYFSRRIAERPANLFFVLRGMRRRRQVRE